MAKAEHNQRTSTCNPHGSKWIRPEKRARIYQRDNWRCVWCGVALHDVEPNCRTLDHVIPRQQGGHNGANNLITCCIGCNCRRLDKTAEEFAWFIAYNVYEKRPQGHVSRHVVKILNRVLLAVSTELPAQVMLPGFENG